MKIFKHRNFMGFIFGIIALIPLFSVLVRCIYIQSNSNAKDSYYGETINQETINFVDEMNVGEDYYFVFPSQPLNIHNINGGRTDTYVQISNLEVIDNSTTSDLSNVSYIGFYSSTDSLVYVAYFMTAPDTPILQLNNNNSNSILLKFNVVTYTPKFTQFFDNNALCFYDVTYNDYSYLDNVFEYSLWKQSNNNIGKIEFFSFFADMFLDLNNPTNALYVGFVNYYFNYLLLVSMTYILFLVLMWFINYCRKLLERGNNFTHGGF